MRKLTWLLLIGLAGISCRAKDAPQYSFKFNEKTKVLYVEAFGETWVQQSVPGMEIMAVGWQTPQGTLTLTMLDARQNRIEAKWQLKGSELFCEVRCSSNVAVSYPWPFVRKVPQESDRLLVPVAEGILYPAHNHSIQPYSWLKGNTGYGISLPLFGTIDRKGSGYGCFAEDPDYFEIKVNWTDQWTLTPTWVPGKNEFGARKCRYQFFQKESRDQAGVAIAKWYRSWLKETGYLVPLSKKKPKHGKPEDLVACPQVWVWSDPLETAQFLNSLGIDRALLANVDPKYWTVDRDVLDQIHEMGYLTGKYDNYEDRWPAELAEITECTKGYPEGLIIAKDGKFVPAWQLAGPDGQTYTGAKLCSGYGKQLIKRDLPKELRRLPYSSRFIDVITASELRECFHPEHPHDRTGDRKDRMAILKFSSQQVLTGAEKGTWWSVAACHYLQGILSLNPYPPADDIGNSPAKILDEVNRDYLRFDVGHVYRFPLFELVAHDCVIPTWYWGDGNNKHPGTWREKDLLTILYGGAPMWCFQTIGEMRNYADSLKASYRFVKPALEQIGLAEMASFAVVSRSGALQQTRWANGAVVTVNFGDTAELLTVEGVQVSIPPQGYHLVEAAAPLPWWKRLF
ncbi:MAG: hypothetical protein COY66_05520 [Candidatus Kerfeldbacteria bacterium CG_4_10_14_0_8_um_filter_42_10]|uniref:Uncharacterized protein n=1 Tax=Candidatus Kerfeldbacteria bacterium CG_4_10_14_0_8_um_filter_42_10 TaxID=2014248 RepID=A0A2M7RHW6_9BACT|nr:MAG: hypothetical protein COY66_05520 [Candidatus Kerfeldbacteria bacterium CG_4_10_14_0_8_um_filter_42_10]